VKTYPIIDKTKGEYPFAFEIDNAYVSPATIARVLKVVDGVSEVSLRKPLGASKDTHIEFKYLGRDHIVWEPYGDSSRYWVGPKNSTDGAGSAGDISGVETALKLYRPPFYRAVLGDVLTLRVFKRLIGRH
jgi:hypothetical protein